MEPHTWQTIELWPWSRNSVCIFSHMRICASLHTFLGCVDDPIELSVPFTHLRDIIRTPGRAALKWGRSLTNLSVCAFSRWLKTLLCFALQRLHSSLAPLNGKTSYCAFCVISQLPTASDDCHQSTRLIRVDLQTGWSREWLYHICSSTAQWLYMSSYSISITAKYQHDIILIGGEKKVRLTTSRRVCTIPSIQCPWDCTAGKATWLAVLAMLIPFTPHLSECLYSSSPVQNKLKSYHPCPSSSCNPGLYLTVACKAALNLFTHLSHISPQKNEKLEKNKIESLFHPQHKLLKASPPLRILLTCFLLSGITNYEEYSLIQEVPEDKKEDGMGTLKKDRTLLLRDERKMEKLKAKLHTDDDCELLQNCCWRRFWESLFEKLAGAIVAVLGKMWMFTFVIYFIFTWIGWPKRGHPINVLFFLNDKNGQPLRVFHRTETTCFVRMIHFFLH